jgi:hypothetical protein
MFNNSSAQSGLNFNQAQQPAPYINPFDMTAHRPPSASGSEFHFGSPAQQPNLMNQLVQGVRDMYIPDQFNFDLTQSI